MARTLGRANLPAGRTVIVWATAAGLVLAGCDGGDGGDGGVDAAGDVESGADVMDIIGDDVEPAADTDSPSPGLGVDYSEAPGGQRPRWEPESEDLTATPWPSDRDATPRGDGTLALDLSRFPTEGIAILEDYVSYGEEVLGGWGLNGSVYVEFEGDLDVGALPDPGTTMDDRRATVQLVDVTPGSPSYGARMPLVFRFHGGDGEDDPYLRRHTLAMRPVYGFPLREATTYCAVVTRAVRDAEGRYLQAAEGWPAAVDSEPSLAPLAAYLDDPAAEARVARGDLAVATCFTTDRPTEELFRVGTYLDTIAPAAITSLEYLGKNTNAQFPFHEFRGYYDAPNFQAGSKPYDQDGDLRFDDDGQPVVQASEPIRFVMLIPTVDDMPDDGWPVVLYAHGTGGSYETCKTQAKMPGPELAKEGFAMICIDQPLHGERAPFEGFDQQATYSFNVANPRSSRTNFRQSAIDTMTLARAVEAGGMDVNDALADGGPLVRFDTAEIHFFGHSHGGLSGALALAVEPRLGAAVLSGAGGVLIETVLRRKDPLDFGLLARTLLDVPESTFDTFHPALTLVQHLVDATDPINYSRYWLDPTVAGAHHVFVTEGTEDAATPSVGTDAMCAAAGLPILEPVAQDSPAHGLKGLDPRTEPLGSNVKIEGDVRGNGYRTAALRQWAGGDHFVAFDDVGARNRWRGFFRAVGEGTNPVIFE